MDKEQRAHDLAMWYMQRYMNTYDELMNQPGVNENRNKPESPMDAAVQKYKYTYNYFKNQLDD